MMSSELNGDMPAEILGTNISDDDYCVLNLAMKYLKMGYKVNSKRKNLAAVVSEHRSAERFPVVCTVEFEEGGVGVTHDLSSTGVFMTTNSALSIGMVLGFCILLQGGAVKLRCEGEVMRVSHDAISYGVAIQFKEYGFDA